MTEEDGVLCFPPHQYFGGLEIRLSDLRSLAAGASKVWFPSEAGIVAVDLKKPETKESAE